MSALFRRLAIHALAIAVVAPALRAQSDTVSTQALQARVTSIRFYERGAGEKTFPYAERFSQATARYIGISVAFELPAATRDVASRFTCTRTSPSGVAHAPEVARFRVQRGWTRMNWTPGPTGWADPGKWAAGTYAVQCFSGGHLIAQGSYVIDAAGAAGAATSSTSGSVSLEGQSAAQLYTAYLALHKEKKYAEGIPALRRAGALGYGLAQSWLGTVYDQGIGVQSDKSAAMHWYLQATEHGIAAAFRGVAELHQTGGGVAQNYAEANKWFRLGAEKGDARSAFLLGANHEHGRGFPASREAAIEWYRQAAAKEYASASAALTRLGASANAGATGSRSAAEKSSGAAGASAANRSAGAAGASGAQAGASCRGEAFSQEGVSGYIDKQQRVSKVDGRDIPGLYRYPDHPSGRPRVELDANGSGIFELWPANPGGGAGRERPMTWWLLTNCDGTPFVMARPAWGTAHILVFQYGPGDLDAVMLSTRNDGTMHILGERVKR